MRGIRDKEDARIWGRAGGKRRGYTGPEAGADHCGRCSGMNLQCGLLTSVTAQLGNLTANPFSFYTSHAKTT